MGIAFMIALLMVAGAAQAQEVVTVVVAARSNVSSAELGKGFDSHCPNVHVGTDAAKANYTLEAIDNELAVRKPYKFTLFDIKGDRVFSTETRRLPSAIGDVCKFLQGTKQK